jgi:hypothetical protein
VLLPEIVMQSDSWFAMQYCLSVVIIIINAMKSRGNILFRKLATKDMQDLSSQNFQLRYPFSL